MPRTEQEFHVTPQEIEAGCQGDLPELVIRGLELFNQKKYFEAHEELELAWRAERGPVREMYRGILQVAVAYYHILNGNYRGAVKMFARTRTWLGPFPDQCRGVDLAGLRIDYLGVEQELLRLGAEHIQWIDTNLMKPVRYSIGSTS